MDAISNCWNALKDGKLGEMLNDLISKITDALNNLFDKLKNFLGDFMNSLGNFVSDFISGVMDQLFDAVKNVVASIGDFVKSIQALKEQLANSSGYFLGNDNGGGATLIDMKGNLRNVQQKNVFKAGSQAQ
jgi:phage-related protein